MLPNKTSKTTNKKASGCHCHWVFVFVVLGPLLGSMIADVQRPDVHGKWKYMLTSFTQACEPSLAIAPAESLGAPEVAQKQI